MNITNKELTDAVQEVIGTVFAYENEFTEHVCPEFKGWSVDEFYIATYRCRAVFIDQDDNKITTTVRTSDVLEWVNKNG